MGVPLNRMMFRGRPFKRAPKHKQCSSQLCLFGREWVQCEKKRGHRGEHGIVGGGWFWSDDEADIPDSDREEESFGQHDWQNRSGEWVCSRCGRRLSVHGEVPPPTYGCASAAPNPDREEGRRLATGWKCTCHQKSDYPTRVIPKAIVLEALPTIRADATQKEREQ